MTANEMTMGVKAARRQQGLNGRSRIQRVVKGSTDGEGLNGWSKVQGMVMDSTGGPSKFWKFGKSN